MSYLRLGVYVITDSRLAGPRGNLEVVRAAIAGGADAIQLREKCMPGAKLYELGLALRRITREAGVLYIVNDRIDLALAVEADGVHVGQDDLPAAIARRLMGPGKVVGVSAATVADAVRALHDGADYLGIGPIYPTGTKADAGEAVGLSVVREIRAASHLPVVGIGGISAGNVEAVIRAGADGVAVISAIVGAPDPREATRAIREAVLRGRAG